MVGIINGSSQWVKEDGLRLMERDAMLVEIASVLSLIPNESQHDVLASSTR
jgi:hypothetical protein